ncbi:LysR family transcriptional regulator [Marinobacter halodurans]|uniref:LysR family transcriptional regulator n=1 Tax=Marinobacter halodurans TaxID=2528979 RepID=A0ABY1ZHQ0_9GAMM|nr:LysR substrate-binding domain-containing protein [Marinobacter halodurans]TBW53332.1 LysR family transcriptional regulator [Marinobacter halodurans]
MRRVTFDLDVLRTYVLGVELGSFARAADRLGRSTSAVSAQLKKLEDQAGTPLLHKAGRGLAMTDAGETLLGYARRMLELNDEAATAIRGADLEGWVRLGLQEDFGEGLLQEVLGQFARAHPKVRVEVRIARNPELLERVTSGRLDLALAWAGNQGTPHAERLGEVPMCWIGAEHRDPPLPTGEPLPLIALEAPCLLRTAATNALDGAGIPWRVAITSPSLAGIWAGVSAGLGVTVRTPIGLPPGLRVLDADSSSLPPLPSLALMLHRSDEALSSVAARLAEILRGQVGALIDAGSLPHGQNRMHKGTTVREPA